MPLQSSDIIVYNDCTLSTLTQRSIQHGKTAVFRKTAVWPTVITPVTPEVCSAAV